MKAVVLAGGEGTRLRPLTCNQPKPMVPLLNRPFLERLLLRLKEHGVGEVALALSYLPEVVKARFGDGDGLGVRLFYPQEERPLGTAGAVKNWESHLDGTFFVFNGDIFTDLDLGEVLRFHREKQAKATIVLTPVEDPTAYGVVEMDPSGRVKRFVEKPPADQVNSRWVNAGTYVLESEVLQYIPAGQHSMFERGLFPLLVDMGIPVYGYPSRAYWLDLSTRLHHTPWPQGHRRL
jgi:mannose-1-phosphate guanylyltransferase